MCFEWCRHQIIYWTILGIKKKKYAHTSITSLVGYLWQVEAGDGEIINYPYDWIHVSLFIYVESYKLDSLCSHSRLRSKSKKKKNTHYDVKSDSQIIIINIYWTLCLSSYLRTYLSLSQRYPESKKKEKKELRLISTMAKGYIRMKTDQDLFNSDVKDLANSVKKLATHVIKLGSLGFFSTFLEWLAACAAM